MLKIALVKASCPSKEERELNKLIKANAPMQAATEYVAKNGWKHYVNGYAAYTVGEPETILELLIQRKFEKRNNFHYEDVDFSEENADNDIDVYELLEYADDMKYFIKDLMRFAEKEIAKSN